MLTITTCHLIQFPSNRWGYVGSVPYELGKIVPADVFAVMGCRTITGENGKPMMFKAATFATEKEARQFAENQGVTLAN